MCHPNESEGEFFRTIHQNPPPGGQNDSSSGVFFWQGPCRPRQELHSNIPDPIPDNGLPEDDGGAWGFDGGAELFSDPAVVNGCGTFPRASGSPGFACGRRYTRP